MDNIIPKPDLSQAPVAVEASEGHSESKDEVFEALLLDLWKRDLSSYATHRVIEWRERYAKAESEGIA